MIGVLWNSDDYDGCMISLLMLMKLFWLLCLLRWMLLVLRFSVYGFSVMCWIVVGWLSCLFNCCLVIWWISGGVVKKLSSLNKMMKISMLMLICWVWCECVMLLRVWRVEGMVFLFVFVMFECFGNGCWVVLDNWVVVYVILKV